MDTQRIAVIAGDGIGPEVIGQALRLLHFLKAEGLPIELWELDLGAERFLRDGTTLPPAVEAEIRDGCAAVLLGALGDPRVPNFEHAEAIVLGLRKKLELYANIRPVRALCDGLVPLKGARANDVDFVVYRENTEGLYSGLGGQLRRGTADEIAVNQDVNTRRAVERIQVAAFEAARKRPRRRLHMADKSNALRFAHELWLRVFRELCERYPDVDAHHVYIDALCAKLIESPSSFDVIVTNNLFGDIVSDLGAALSGGLGMTASQNVRPERPGHVGIFEPVHGSAPDLVGSGRANPFGALLSTALMLDHLGFGALAAQIESAVAAAVAAGEGTPDIGGSASTEQAGSAVLKRVQAALRSA